jgi:hypothetical protein
MLLKIILFIVVIYFIIRFFSRFLLSLFISNINNKFTQAQGNYYNEKNHRKEGEVFINKSSGSEKRHKINEGEYVDFEEIKE